MASSKDFFTHDEIWDDSALVNAWDEALQEYKVGAVRIASLQKLVACLPDRGSQLLMWRTIWVRSTTALMLLGRISWRYYVK